MIETVEDLARLYEFQFTIYREGNWLIIRSQTGDNYGEFIFYRIQTVASEKRLMSLSRDVGYTDFYGNVLYFLRYCSGKEVLMIRDDERDILMADLPPEDRCRIHYWLHSMDLRLLHAIPELSELFNHTLI